MAGGLPWIPWDVGYFRNPKARAAGKNGRALHFAASLWSADNLTDGVIRPTDLPLLCAEAEVPRSTVDVCVREGLFDLLPSGEGWLIHDFLPRNKSRAEVDKQRQDWAQKKARQREMSPGDTQGDSHGTPTLRETERQTERVRTEKTCTDDDDELPGKPPSSSWGIELQVAHQLARHQARTTPPKKLAPWLAATRRAISDERHEDIARALIRTRGNVAEAVTILTQPAADTTPERRPSFYTDPSCPDCEGREDGLRNVGNNTWAPCPCRRPEPYVATVHPIRGDSA